MFGKKKRQVIKFEQNLCNANLDDNEILFVRVSDVVNDSEARLEVPITHDAIVIKGGGDMRYYKSGTYNVFDDKKEVKNWKSGLSVEVIYIPKDTRVLILWGTPNRVQYREEMSKKVVSVGARGEFDVSVTNPEQFFRKVVGVKKEFNIDEFRRRFRETVATEFADLFLKVVAAKHLSYDMFTGNKKAIGESMGEILSPMFERDWGLSVLNFKISDFDLSEEDIKAVEDAFEMAEKEIKDEKLEEKREAKIEKHLKELERLDDKQWEREKYLRNLQMHDKTAYYEVLKVIGCAQKKEEDKKEYKCQHCGIKYEPPAIFCAHCGNRVSKEPVSCPKCGKVNAYDSLFCAGCGRKMRER